MSAIGNHIVEIKTVQGGSREEPIFAIMLAANVLEPASLRAFVAELVETFKAQRMISPPETSHLLISIRGETSAGDVKAAWNELVATDEVLRFFVSQLRVADVVRAARTGPALEQVSLLDVITRSER
jgi:hypothetical protein